MSDTNAQKQAMEYALTVARKLITKGDLTDDERAYLVVTVLAQSEAVQKTEYGNEGIMLLLAAGGLASDTAYVLTSGGNMIRLSEIADALKGEMKPSNSGGGR